MDEQKQIEEMATAMCDNCRSHTPNCESIICDSAIEAAEAVFAAGYRKQSEGEWKESGEYICNSDGKAITKIGVVFICSVCGREERHKEPYCHCGAKMKGE